MQKELKFSFRKLVSHMFSFLNILTANIIGDIMDSKDFTWAQPTGTLHRRKIHEVLLSKKHHHLWFWSSLSCESLKAGRSWNRLPREEADGHLWKHSRLGWTGLCFS